MRRARLVPPGLAAALAILVAAGPPPTQQDLQEAEHARAADVATQQAAASRAKAAAEKERTLAQQRVATAAKLRDAEEALATVSAKVADLTQQRADAEARLAARAADLAPVLPMIERLSLYPAETLLAVPMPPEQAVRGVLVLGGLARTLEQEAAALRAEQAQVAALRTQEEAALPGLAAAQLAQAQLGQALDSQIAEAHRARRAAEDTATEAARRAASDASRADSIRAAIARIDADRRAAEEKARADTAAPLAKPDETTAQAKRDGEAAATAQTHQEAMAQPPVSNMIAARGQLTAPVVGSVVRGFGAPTEAGPASGVSYQAPPNARVVSPCGGRVAFAGPFRSFGLLMIVDCGNGYHFVMSGLDRLDGQVGQAVQPGEPVGVMPGWDPQSTAGSRPTLYLELRKDGVPVNPAPFLRARS
jgi:septal ring factor EnvC (AmiA/AmiB activator)